MKFNIVHIVLNQATFECNNCSSPFLTNTSGKMNANVWLLFARKLEIVWFQSSIPFF